MSKFEFRLPDIGEGVTEGEIVNWLVGVGDAVEQDQDMVEVMTDKATVTIGAPKPGKVAELKGGVGDVVPVGQVLVVLDVGAGGGEAPKAEAPKAEAPKAEAKPEAKPAPAPKAEPAKPAPAAPTAASAVGDIKDDLPGMAPSSNGASSSSSYFNDKPLAAPATRKAARELDVDIRKVVPTGSGQRVTREDVEAYARGGSGKAGAEAPAPESAPGDGAGARPALVPGASDERVPIRGLRRRIFENMARSKRTAAHFTYAEECEGSALIALRGRLKSIAEAEGVRLNYLPFIVKAVVAALHRNKTLNAIVDDEKGELVLKKTFDIGIAVATDAGLIVPVLRHADQLSLIETAREIDRLGKDAREGKIKREDLGGSSFTITSLGKLGGLFATPVINYPEVAILYVAEMKKKPVVKDDQIVVGNVMQLSVSFDHRIVDGHIGAAFALDVISFLENPDQLLLHMK
jgi:pyruvate/2-oxoglutarate dehydrogenase complex dihydrolipoamide acyltransferase (E2) component